MINLMKRFMNEESGQGMTEYGLVIAIVAIGLIAIMGTFRDKIAAVFNDAGTELDAYPATSGATTTP